MNHNEIRLVLHLTELARRLKSETPEWAWADWATFQTVMLRQPRPDGPLFEVTDRQFTRCLRHAFVEVSYRP